MEMCSEGGDDVQICLDCSALAMMIPICMIRMHTVTLYNLTP